MTKITLKKVNLILLIVAAMLISFYLLGGKPIISYADGMAEIVIEQTTGKILYEKNKDAKLPMASTTKIMTALIIIEDCNLTDEFIVDDSAVGKEGSSIYLKKGEKVTVKDMLYGLMLRSGNDSAVALAIYDSGSESVFVEKMNDKAKELVLLNTHFENCSGLPSENHYTTAYELATLAKYAMQNDTFRQIVATREYKGKYRNFTNKNKLLQTLNGADGIKTGYTIKAGRCLVSSSHRNNMHLICVVLNCYDMYDRSIKLMESAFNDYKIVNIDKDAIFMSDIVQCKLDKTYSLLVKKDSTISYKVVPIKNIKKIRKGDTVGTLEIYCQKDLIFSQNLYSIVNR